MTALPTILVRLLRNVAVALSLSCNLMASKQLLLTVDFFKNIASASHLRTRGLSPLLADVLTCVLTFVAAAISKNGRVRKPRSLLQIRDQNFFNRILHLINARPKEGRRMIVLGAAALCEL